MNSLAFLFIIGLNQVQNPDPRPDHYAAVRALPEKFITAENAVGVSVAILDGNGVQFTASAGWANREKQIAASQKTLFRLGSVSKPVAATALMLLVENGKVNLKDNVLKYAPTYGQKQYPVLLSQVLGHTAGVRHYLANRNESLFENRTTQQSIAMIKDDPLLFEPDTKYSYSTHSYALVVAAIEKASGKSYPQFLRDSISKKFSETLDCEILSDSKPERTQLYTPTPKDPRLELVRENNSWKFGGGGLESNALDLAKFGKALLDAKILKPKTRDQMWANRTLKDGKPTNYGLGWVVMSPTRVGHSGGQQGCSAFLLIDKERKIVVSVLCNTSGRPVRTLAEQLLNAWPK